MCYSVEVSVVTGTILIPAGLICLKKTAPLDKPYWAFALLPFMFGIQQLFEAGVWLTVEDTASAWLRTWSLGFLFFSHLFWLSWVPLSSWLTETDPARRRLFVIVTVLGFIFGLSLYLPLLANPDWLAVSARDHSIYYSVTLLYDGHLNTDAIIILYSVIILLPLLLSSDNYHKLLGMLVMIAGFVTWFLFEVVFISVWCYFAAVISLYIYYMVVYSKHKVSTT